MNVPLGDKQRGRVGNGLPLILWRCPPLRLRVEMVLQRGELTGGPTPVPCVQALPDACSFNLAVAPDGAVAFRPGAALLSVRTFQFVPSPEGKHIYLVRSS